MTLFGRQVVLQLGTEGNPGRSFRDLRVSFRVDMSRTLTANTCALVAYNLSPESVALAQQPGAIVRLLAGYDVPRLIFRGNPIRNGVTQTKQGPDRLLQIEAQDGGRQLAAARVNVVFKTQTTLAQVLDEVGRQLGLPTGTIRIDGTAITYPNGVTLVGPARDVLDRLALSTSSDFLVRDGALHVIPSDGDTGEQAIRFSVAQGNLIGSPKATDDGIEIVGLLEPSMRPGRPFVVESDGFDGVYVARDVVFLGDSGWDQAYYVQVRGRPRV